MSPFQGLDKNLPHTRRDALVITQIFLLAGAFFAALAAAHFSRGFLPTAQPCMLIPVASATIEYDARLIIRSDSLVADATGALRYYHYRGLKPTAKVILSLRD